MPSLTPGQLETFLRRVKQGVSPIELVYTPHDMWPYLPGKSPTSPLRISVLDSSFNPPTRAHLALASLPPFPDSPASPNQYFDARLLLLSVRNADKSLKPTDATYAQRLEMMIRLAREVVPPSHEDHTDSNVAVAIIDEPTFVGKARVLDVFLRQRMISLSSPPSISSTPELTFLVGMDTLERILATRYYLSPSEMRADLMQLMATSRLICARRVMAGEPGEAQAKEREVISLAGDYLDLQRLVIVDLDGDVESYSSSEVRRRIGEGSEQLWMKMVTSDIAEYIVAHGLYNVASVAPNINVSNYW
ncbi:hypothetical protein BC835DRAFT_1381343 [Cytidiella melzeri]|nr:hypothetical protein BC835DRAFT_1381343 [Cytidiella melzeri]